ncbi:MAG: bifunctional diaminohydroxyphosphoribosylaminopyrimidine deaminase/5-amino-6-(5-phosphoribosylamino)uracil reductase RibD [Kiritimatiellae bacterium]|nr:bifunctional diaminohydroxyphosphoribosylaminopyrimidine deaminase/5-amino-6-(5-phosphoribosylamino)uracil reductase RibD [Kiritimatiellia bacterium]
MTQEAQDTRWMRRAIALARLSEGLTRPNPPVGAVVVRDGRKLGEGRHRCAGCAHAEVEALDACREPAAGATLYVTLEPCCTQGRTPPCTERILREKIARVVVGCRDENGCHCGRGLEMLTERGVEVVAGVCGEEARELVVPFFKHITTGLPFVTLKLALTMDGRIADRRACSQWITGEEARAEVQRMRRRADAVMVGAGTVVADNPSLLCRDGGGEKLMRVIVDGRGCAPAAARVFTDGAASRTLLVTSRGVSGRKEAAWMAHGAKVWKCPADKQSQVSLKRLLRRLAGTGIMHVLCEGGGRLAGALHDAGLVDEYCFFYAPAVLGDGAAFGAVEGCGTLLPKMSRMRCVEVRRFGEDVMMRVRKA